MILPDLNRLLLLYLTILLISIYSCNTKPNRFKEKNNNEVNNKANDTLPRKINFRIFIENSASMDGYVSSETDFKNTVYGLITDLKAKQIADAIELNYINDKICNLKTNAIPEDIEYFIKNLKPETFEKNSCDSRRGTSDIPNIISQVINLKDNEVSILVSDFIFSSGSDSKSFLSQQSNSIEMLLSQELKSKEISSIIYKCNSNFIGTYYKESLGGGKGETINGKRPYYIMVFGNNKSLDKFLTDVNFNDYKGFESSYFLLTPNADRPSTKILRINKKGKFEIEAPATKLIINEVSPDDNQLFQFSIASNLNFHKMDDSFLINPNNYELSSNYKLVSISKITDETDESLKGYSHIFTIQSNNVKDNQEVNIKFKSKFPSWVKESSTEDDSNPKSYESQTKTFGFSYLVEGISQAYENKYKGKEQFGITIKVSKNNYNSKGRSTGIPWVLIICILGISMSLIYFKIKK